MVNQRKNIAHKHSFVVISLALLFLLSLSGCEKNSGVGNQNLITVSAQEFYDYANNEFGFTAQFPAKPNEKPSSQDGLEEVIFSSQGNAESSNSQIRTTVNVLKFAGPVSELDSETQGMMIETLVAERFASVSGKKEVAVEDLPIESGTRSGCPSASLVIPIIHNEQKLWCYSTAVFCDGFYFTQGGIRLSEADAIVAETSLKVLTGTQTTREPNMPSKPQIPSNAIEWTKAKKHVGEVVTVYGDVVGSTYASSSNGQPTFMDIGAPYPDPKRLSVVIWREDIGNFSADPEDMYRGKSVCVTGEVYLYKGAPYIKVTSPAQMEIID